MQLFRPVWVLVLFVVLVAAGCAAPTNSGTARTPGTAPAAGPGSAGSDKAQGSLVIFAASSLTDVMETLRDGYVKDHPGVSVRINYGSSAQLVQQLQSGAAADLVLTADEESLQPLQAAGMVAASVVVASNNLVLALPKGNPARITQLRDVTAPGVAVARCAPSVPCGRAADRVLAAAGLSLSGASAEDNVRAVLTKVSAGQVDAGFVYRTDALAARGAGVTYLPLTDPSPNRYPLALTRQGTANPVARPFYDWLSGPAAAAVLEQAGFGPGAGGQGSAGPEKSSAEKSSPGTSGPAASSPGTSGPQESGAHA